MRIILSIITGYLLTDIVMYFACPKDYIFVEQPKSFYEGFMNEHVKTNLTLKFIKYVKSN